MKYESTKKFLNALLNSDINREPVCVGPTKLCECERDILWVESSMLYEHLFYEQFKFSNNYNNWEFHVPYSTFKILNFNEILMKGNGSVGKIMF